MESAVLFEIGVELLQVVLCELVQRYFTDGRDNMEVYCVLIFNTLSICSVNIARGLLTILYFYDIMNYQY